MTYYCSKFGCLVVLLVTTLCYSVEFVLSDDCSSAWPTLTRLGNTRFYLFDKPGKDNKLSTEWKDADARCKGFDASLRLANHLDKISTNGIISGLMTDVVKTKGFIETFYWISARYDMATDFYRWIDNNNNNDANRSSSLPTPVKYSNFHYYQPRPTGVGAHFGTSNSKSKYGGKEIYSTKSDVVQCLVYALPYRHTDEAGWQPSWMEKACEGRTHRRVLCESTNPACEQNLSKNPHVLTEDKEYYYTEGNWIFANRRFIVNWKPRQFDEAKEYCAKFGLQLFTPVPADDCLMPYLKLWAPVLMTYHFWTYYTYDSHTTEFLDSEGNLIQKGPFLMHNYVRSNKHDRKFCVSYLWAYEFRNESKCAHCDWTYHILAPANCFNYFGTICQHPEPDNTRHCDFRSEWHSDFQLAVDSTAVVEFGYRGSGLWRSTYKQTFGSRICGDPDRQMMDVSTEYWAGVEPKGVDYLYDYEETYWVVDDESDGFRHAGKEDKLCTVSTLQLKKKKGSSSRFERVLSKVSCLEWHFYLCESVL